MREELGVDCDLKWALRTHYRADVGNGLIEDEVVHLFVGAYDGAVTPDPEEVAGFEWVSRADLRARIAGAPGSLHLLVPALHARVMRTRCFQRLAA